MMDELATRGDHLDPNDFCISWANYGLDRRPFGGTRKRWTHLARLLLDAPEGMHVDHLCRNIGCIRLDHLEIVTPRENTIRGITSSKSTHCKKCGSDEFEPYKTSCNGTSRRCVICRRKRDREGHRRRYHKKA